MAHELRFLDRANASIWLFPTSRGHVARLFDGTHYRGELPITEAQLQAAVDGASIALEHEGHVLIIEPDMLAYRVTWRPAKGKGFVDVVTQSELQRASDAISSKSLQEFS